MGGAGIAFISKHDFLDEIIVVKEIRGKKESTSIVLFDLSQNELYSSLKASGKKCLITRGSATGYNCQKRDFKTEFFLFTKALLNG